MPVQPYPDFNAFELSDARKEMLERKAAVVAAMPEWRPENWKGLKEPERWEVLQKTERAFADLEKRTELPVTPLREAILKQYPEAIRPDGVTWAPQGNPEAIELNEKHVKNDNPDMAMKTYFHEEHHVEQYLTIDKPELRPDFSARQREGWEYDMKLEDKLLDLRDVPAKESRTFAHEQSAELESTRLYARCMNKMYPERDAKEPDSWDMESSSSLERFVRDRSDDQTKTDRDDHGFSSRLEEFVYDPAAKTKDEPLKQPALELSKHKEEQEPER